MEGEYFPYGVVCMISETLFVLSRSVGTNYKVQKGLNFSLDKGAGYKIIRRNALPFFWKHFIDTQGDVPLLNDANGQPLSLYEMVFLTVRLVNTHYVLNFVIFEHLAVDVIIGTDFLSEQFSAIRCRE